MKKILTLTLALLMMIVGTAAMAANAAPVSEARTFTIPKKYVNYVNGVENPSQDYPREELAFVVDELVKYSSAGYDDDLNAEVPMLTVDSLTVAGVTNNVTIRIPSYKYAGVFVYKITETAGNSAGVTYDSAPIYISIKVIGEERNGQFGYFVDDGNIVVTSENGMEGDTKKSEFVNTVQQHNLSVIKLVKGELGSYTTTFPVTVTLTTDKVPATPITLNRYTRPYGDENLNNWTSDQDFSQVTIPQYTDNNGGDQTWKYDAESNLYKLTVQFQVKNAVKYELANIPDDVKYTVSEAENINYTTAYSYAVGGNAPTETAPEKLNADTVVSITNTAKHIAQTGLVLMVLPYVLILAIVAVGAALLIITRRKKANDEF